MCYKLLWRQRRRYEICELRWSIRWALPLLVILLYYFSTFLLLFVSSSVSSFISFFLSLYIHFSSSFQQSSSFIFSSLRHNLHFFLLFLLLEIWFQKIISANFISFPLSFHLLFFVFNWWLFFRVRKDCWYGRAHRDIQMWEMLTTYKIFKVRSQAENTVYFSLDPGKAK